MTGWLSDLFNDQSDFQLVTRGWKGPFESPGREYLPTMNGEQIFIFKLCLSPNWLRSCLVGFV